MRDNVKDRERIYEHGPNAAKPPLKIVGNRGVLGVGQGSGYYSLDGTSQKPMRSEKSDKNTPKIPIFFSIFHVFFESLCGVSKN